jgi:hypothetical protein
VVSDKRDPITELVESFRVFGDPIETPERHRDWHRVNGFPMTFYGVCGPCTRSVPLTEEDM